MAGAKPKPGFYIAVAIVCVALIAYALNRFSAKEGGGEGGGTFTADEMSQMQSPAEEADSAGITTVKEYAFVPGQRLPDVQGVSNYSPLDEARTVRFAINVWAGWGPIILANGGFAPGKTWTTPSGEPFQVELVLIDDPVAMRDSYAAGEVHIGWATLDMVPLFMEALSKDSRVMPRIYQQVDWSNGGDGIVVRDSIRTMSDLRGKTIVLAQNSPSHYFVLNALINSGLQPAEVTFKFTQDAFQAAAAFNADKSISACVSWAPDIYNLADVAGNRMLVTSATANHLIADVWFARADFAKDNPDIIEGLVRGIFDAMVELKQQSAQVAVSELMADGFAIPASETLAMLGDAHSTNYAENRDFFLNQNNPTNFERTWNNAYFLYKRIRAVSGKTPFDQVMDFSVIKKLAGEAKYASQKNEYEFSFAPSSASTIQAESSEILTKTVVIHFFPNSWELEKMVTKTVDGKTVSQEYDPNWKAVVREVGELAGQYGAAHVVIEGHADSSMKGRVSPALVKDLSANRANAVKQALLREYPELPPNQFASDGLGWERPADAADPLNQAKNRRVEIKVYPAESTGG